MKTNKEGLINLFISVCIGWLFTTIIYAFCVNLANQNNIIPFWKYFPIQIDAIISVMKIIYHTIVG